MSVNNHKNSAVKNKEKLEKVFSDEYWEQLTDGEWKAGFVEWWMLTNYGVSDLSLTDEQINNLQQVVSDNSQYVAEVNNILNTNSTTVDVENEVNSANIYNSFKEVLSLLNNYNLREDFFADLPKIVKKTTVNNKSNPNKPEKEKDFDLSNSNNSENLFQDNQDLEESENGQTNNSQVQNQTEAENTESDNSVSENSNTSNSESVNEEFVATTQEVIRVDVSSEDVFTPQFDSGYDAVGLDDFNNTFGANVDGSGFSMVIIDTGIDLDHSVFADRIAYSYDFYGNNDNNAQDYNGHGSHVSSIAGNIASGADIIHLKVFDDSGLSASMTDVYEALQWVTSNIDTYNIASVNLSLGSGNYNTEVVSSFSNVFQTLANNDVIVAAAAGNDFYGNSSEQGVNVFGAHSDVITVGAVYEENEGAIGYGSGATDYSSDVDRIASFSQRHETLLDIFAPGALITGANATGGYMASAGTSQASPFIAGIATLAQDLAVQELGRRLSVEEFRDLMQVTGVTINDGDDENDNVTNTGLDFQRVDAYNLGMAITAAGTTGVLAGFNDNFQAGTNSNDTLNGSNSIDYIFGSDGADFIKGYNGNDILVGGDGNDTIYAGANHDIVYGGSGQDNLLGKAGNDTLYGGAGRDTLSGNNGSDLFVLDDFGSYDIITDFNSSQGDKIGIDVQALGISDASLDDFSYSSQTINIGWGPHSNRQSQLAVLYPMKEIPLLP